MSDRDDFEAQVGMDIMPEIHAKSHAATQDRYAACGCVFSPAAQDQIKDLKQRVDELLNENRRLRELAFAWERNPILGTRL